jgi:hypothetical protein
MLHVVADLICVFLVSGQLVLLSALPKLLHFFCGQKVCILLFFWKNFVSTNFNPFLSCCLGVQISLPYKRMGRASALYTFIFEDFWTNVDLKVIIIIIIIIIIMWLNTFSYPLKASQWTHTWNLETEIKDSDYNSVVVGVTALTTKVLHPTLFVYTLFTESEHAYLCGKVSASIVLTRVVFSVMQCLGKSIFLFYAFIQ